MFSRGACASFLALVLMSASCGGGDSSTTGVITIKLSVATVDITPAPLNIATGIAAIRRSRSLVTPAIAGAVFAAVGVLHWPMLLVVACLAPVSIAIAWRRRHG